MFRNIVVVFLFALQVNLILTEGTADSPGDEIKLPESCVQTGNSYCFEKGGNYPDEMISIMLKNTLKLKVETQEVLPSIDSRNGDFGDEPDCPDESSDKPIYYIIDENDKVRVVVQSPDKFQQIFSVRWCVNEGRITHDTSHFMKGYTLENFFIECVSTKMHFEFLVLSDNMKTMEVAKAKGGIPVCCSCRYRK